VDEGISAPTTTTTQPRVILQNFYRPSHARTYLLLQKVIGQLFIAIGLLSFLWRNTGVLAAGACCSSRSSSLRMWHASTDTPPPIKKSFTRCLTQITYLSSGLVVSLCRRDLLSALVSAGCSHLAIKIFAYLGMFVITAEGRLIANLYFPRSGPNTK
jgi:hypothetical protein